MPTIEFKRFKPSSDLAIHSETILLQLADFVPTGATIYAYIAKLKEKYQCYIQVISESDRFVQNALSVNPVHALDDVSEKLKNEILNWKLDHLNVNEASFWNFKEIKT
jgi:hypothetical protein